MKKCGESPSCINHITISKNGDHEQKRSREQPQTMWSYKKKKLAGYD